MLPGTATGCFPFPVQKPTSPNAKSFRVNKGRASHRLLHLFDDVERKNYATKQELFPTTPFPDSFTVADNPGTMRVRLKSDRGWIKLKWRAIEMHPVQQVTITLVGAERFKIRLSVHSSKVRITLGQSRLEKLEHPVRLSEGSVVDGKTDW